MASKPHPGITMHKITFSGGFIGVLFAAGSALIFVLGFPTLWYFVALAAALGVGIAVVLRVLHRTWSDRNKPLSILTAREPEASKSRERMEWHKSLRIVHVASA